MPDVILIENQNQKVGVKRVKRHSLRIDMTPMVDLGFLLISFFVMTIQLSKPYEVRFNMPKDANDRTELQESAALTVLLGKNHDIWYYYGKWDDAIKQGKVFKTSFSYKNGFGDVIREKQILLDNNPIIANGRRDLTILIKPSSNSSYKGIVDALDEIMINNVNRYSLVKISSAENAFLTDQDKRTSYPHSF